MVVQILAQKLDACRSVVLFNNVLKIVLILSKQIVANVKDEEDDEYAKLQARGVPKFLIEMEQRAIERNRKHKEAKDRREQLEKEKEELRLAAEEAKVNELYIYV